MFRSWSIRLKSLATPSALAIAFLVLFSTAARADDFSFSFTNSTGTTSGTVTGVIYGLTDNSTGAPTDVVITSVPVGLGIFPPFGSLPIDVTSKFHIVNAHSFTVTGGVITSYDFDLINAAVGGELKLTSGEDFLTLDGDTTSVENGGGTTFADLSGSSSSSAATPEPSSLALLGTGVLGVFGAVRRRMVR